MLSRFLTVGGLTLLSRLTGFARDIMLAAILGAGPVADAFLVALRLPNHFRAIFAEGAFSAAFVPSYARIREANGPDAAQKFADQIFTLLLASSTIWGDPPAGAGLRGRSGPLRARHHAHPHHLSVSAADDAGPSTAASSMRSID